MLIEVAELIAKIPEKGGIAPLLEGYKTDEALKPDVVVDASFYRYERHNEMQEQDIAYLESGSQFHYWLLHFGGMMLHASAVELDGKAYLFSGPCGMGKSTHTNIWQQLWDKAIVFNDDKPALRRLDGRWYAYGTPWCGKEGINVNMKVPLAGICFLRRGDKNSIRQLYDLEAAKNVIAQTLHRFKDESNLSLMLSHVDKLICEIPIFELENRPDTDAALLSYETMCRAAKEVGL
jgi:hypothetical protein